MRLTSRDTRWQLLQLSGNAPEIVQTCSHCSMVSPCIMDFKHVRHGSAVQVPFTVPADLASGLEKVAEQLRASLHDVLLTAFSVLLMRYSRESDITLGCAIPLGASQVRLSCSLMYCIRCILCTAHKSHMSQADEALGLQQKRPRSAREIERGATAYEKLLSP